MEQFRNEFKTYFDSNILNQLNNQKLNSILSFIFNQENDEDRIKEVIMDVLYEIKINNFRD